MEKPTKSQMQYLMTWLSMEGNRGRSFASIALKHKVTKATIQRMMNALVEREILDEKYKLTQDGLLYVEWYKSRYQSLVTWLNLHNIENSVAEDTAYTWMADSHESVIEMLVNECMICSVCRKIVPEKGGETNFEGIDLADFLPDGIYDVRADFIREETEDTEVEKGKRSMADKAFEKPAKLTIKDGYSEILLKRLRIFHISFLERDEVGGKMKTMEYVIKGTRKKAAVDGDVVKVPTKDILWYCSRDKMVLFGKLKVSFTSTVGTMHMPKRTAVLVIRLANKEKMA